ncbi:hypothetical protein [Ekhidna sp.]|uniref:hypothetical protein n=1 Tax=Ekhidna sp. TaxID=2608089 RepID=UPI003CCBD50C
MIFRPKKKIFILGNQKSGTSAIANLTAEAGGLSKTIDIPKLWPPYIQKLVKKEVNLSDVVRSNKKYFKSELIKEPNLTFLFEELLRIYPNAEYAMVVRNPFGNIRSILNRYKLSGKIDALNQEQIFKLGNHYNLFQAENWNLEQTDNPIEALALRWNLAASVFINYKDHVNISLIRYEDFTDSKSESIYALCDLLNTAKRNDISKSTEIQFQPKGDNSLSYLDFFGPTNFSLIKETCWPLAAEFDYGIE